MSDQSKPRLQPLHWALLLIFAGVLFANSWLVDDAFITFRTVQNLLQGYGPTWNVAERVQAYSHPLWLLFMTAASAVTGEVFYAAIVVSLSLSVCAVVVAAWAMTGGFRRQGWKPPLLLLVFLSSKAVSDYSSSGLEYPLAYAIAACFASILMNSSSGVSPEKTLRLGFLLASFAFLTRPDALLLYVPGLVYLLAACRGFPWTSRAGSALAWFSPAWVWTLFSVFYYGYPLPNTAYAKSICTGYPSAWVVERGLDYAWNSIQWDVASPLMVGLAGVLSARARDKGLIALMLGVLMYTALVVVGLAATTHMSGRHLALPWFVALLLFVHLTNDRRWALVTSVCLAVHALVSPVSVFKFGTAAYRPYPQNPSYIDAKFAVYDAGGALLSADLRQPFAGDPWYTSGTQMRFVSPDKVHVIEEAVGLAGFAAGPTPYIIDRLGLTEPLLSRVPAILPGEFGRWKSGHFPRDIPNGYVESSKSLVSAIEDDDLKHFDTVVRRVTRGRLVSAERFRDIWDLNRGRFSGRLGVACFGRGPGESPVR